MLKKILQALFIIFLVTNLIHAENLEFQTSSEDMKEFEQLMSMIDKYSDLATKTRMNSDFVPGILTVITRDEMEISGLKTVEDVLMTLAGINIYIDSTGFRIMSVRGIGGANASGNVKIMLNNISLSDSISSVSDFILDYPVELLQRIELIRGPGSAIYGEHAYTGVINIITRNKDSIASFGLGSLSTLSGSALLNYNSQEYPINLSAFIHGFKSDGSDAITGPDAYYAFQDPEIRKLSLAPGPTNERKERKIGFVSLNYLNTEFSANFNQIYNGDSMGMYHYLYNLREDTPNKLRNNTYQLSHNFDISPQINAIIKGGYQKYECIFEHKYVFPPKHPYFSELNVFYLERKKYANLDLFYKIDDHQLLFSFEYNAEKHIYSVKNITSYRHLYSLLSQYEGQIFEGFSFTGGIRYDNYDDIDNSISPRLAGVYQFNSNNILKFQYQKAFRPLTKTELINAYLTSYNLVPSKINTYEMSYIYKNSFSRFRFSLYESELNDVIHIKVYPPLSDWNYENISKVRARGIEIELEQQISNHLKFNMNSTFMYTKNLENNKKMPLQAEFIANAAFIYSPFKYLDFSTRYKYVGDRSRDEDDKRSNLAGYHKFDTSVMFHAVKISTKIRFGIDNLLNEKIYVPTSVAHLFNKEQTYPEDFPLKGRTMWFDIVYEY